MSKLRRGLIILISIVIVMLIIPLLAIEFASPDSGMMICLLLFFIVNPALSVFIGVFAGKDLKYFWFSPIVVATFFRIFSTFTFTTAFPIIYSVIYFAICAVSETITYLITKKTR